MKKNMQRNIYQILHLIKKKQNYNLLNFWNSSKTLRLLPHIETMNKLLFYYRIHSYIESLFPKNNLLSPIYPKSKDSPKKAENSQIAEYHLSPLWKITFWRNMCIDGCFSSGRWSGGTVFKSSVIWINFRYILFTYNGT